MLEKGETMKKYPTKKEMDALPGLTNARLKEFAMQHGLEIPHSIKKKEGIIHWIHRFLESPSNIVIDYNIPDKCKSPQGYDQNVWKEMVERAKKEKTWAYINRNKFEDRQSITNEIMLAALKKSVFEIAKGKYDYLNYRAHAIINDPGSWMHGHPLDAADLKEWNELSAGKGKKK
jgi:hypothetical protein